MYSRKDKRIRNKLVRNNMNQKNDFLDTVYYLYDIINLDGYLLDDELLKVIVDYGEETETSDPKAQAVIGYCYRYGKGIERDDIQSVKWFEKAAEQGNPCGQHYLGICYYMNQGVIQDYCKAFELQTLSAAQGHLGAMYDLASAYYYGHGVEKNVDMAVDWLKRAIRSGSDAAEAFLIAILYPEYVAAMNAEIEAELRALENMDDF